MNVGPEHAEPPVPAAAMTDEQFDDFISEMYVAVQEEAQLWELPRGVIDRLPTGDVVHGPWRPEDCAAVQLAWFDLGLTYLYGTTETGANGDDLGPTARHLLTRPEQWVQPVQWSDVVHLCPTDRGTKTEYQQWQRAVEHLRAAQDDD